MDRADKISQINLKVFCKTAVAKFYLDEPLQKAELAAINAIKEEVRDKKILEIGVGGGKTINFLKQISSDYTGIDYSKEMVNECRKKFPDTNVIRCDARDMSIFKSDEFDFILWAFNGIDYVSHNDRLQILREVYRVLKKFGYFVFSTHNRNCSAFKTYTSPLASFITHNPLKTESNNTINIGSRLANLLRSTVNHWKNGRFVIHTDKYSIINDKAHDYSLVTYYIDIDNQKKQLYATGFRNLPKIYDKQGKEITGDSEDTWIYYSVKK